MSDFCHVKVVPPYAKKGRPGSARQELLRSAPNSAMALFENKRHNDASVGIIEAELNDRKKDIRCIVGNNAIVSGEPYMDEEMRSLYETKVVVDLEKAVNVAMAPQGSELWHRERKVRITGSICHGLLTYARKQGDWSKKLESLEKGQKWTGNSATLHGIRAEKNALDLYESICPGRLLMCGLVVQPGPWLACSPDGVVMHNDQPYKLVEVKSPVCGKTMPAGDMITNKKVPWLQVDGENVTLKKNHHYYGQVQLGMALLNVSSCDLVVSGKCDIALITVPRDDDYITDLVGTMHGVFFNVMLPHLVESSKTQ